MKFYTSDQHFNHKAILNYRNFTGMNLSEMEDFLVVKWNKRITKLDEVYILGDFCYSNEETVLRILKRLKGKKYIIRGNHDTYETENLLSTPALEWVKDYAYIEDNGDGIALFHYPMAVWQNKHKGALHFYGHVHRNDTDYHPLEYNLFGAYHVGVDTNDFEPKTKKEILERDILKPFNKSRGEETCLSKLRKLHY